MAKKKTSAKSGAPIDPELEMFAARLKALRIKKGYTSYEAFANDHGISRALYGRYEKGKNLRYSSLVKLIKALGMSKEEFFSEGFDKPYL